MGSLATNDVLKSPEVCDSFNWLIKRQKALCRKNLHLMGPVTRGAIRAIEECQHQFTTRRWNCSTVNTSSVFGNVLNQGELYVLLPSGSEQHEVLPSGSEQHEVLLFGSI